jgi:hypothetical protein
LDLACKGDTFCLQAGRSVQTGTDLQLEDGYFVLAHPLFMVLVPYGLYLTFASYLCPTTCLPASLPLASLANYLGNNYNFLMGVISAIAAALHVGNVLIYTTCPCLPRFPVAGEAVQAWFLASVHYRLNSVSILLWTLNVFFFGITGFWPLAFPQFFQDVKDTYCVLPGALCLNTQIL